MSDIALFRKTFHLIARPRAYEPEAKKTKREKLV
jgi:hypothetical protein